MTPLKNLLHNELCENNHPILKNVVRRMFNCMAKDLVKKLTAECQNKKKEKRKFSKQNNSINERKNLKNDPKKRKFTKLTSHFLNSVQFFIV